MTDKTATPDTIVLERTLPVPPDRVFRAWADREERVQWDVPGGDWVIAEFEQDFRVDGIERSRFGPKDKPIAESFGRFLLIEPDRRIVSAGVMRSADTGTVSSTTMMTLDLRDDGDRTHLTLIDQSVYLGEGETADMRRSGWGAILANLEQHLTG